ncbi:MAG: glycosyltransferase family 39 protein [Acidobacteriota bacterium]|nr:glycosyltransferase family 39 protein [Acidobacteriota bacterium]
MAGWLAGSWPLLLLVAAGATLRLSTLSLQSLWYDEAFTAAHVFGGSLSATLSQIPHTENTPPLWYVLEWAVIQVGGDGAFALRLLSALAGIALIGVAWAIGAELAGRRAAILAAAIATVSPLFVWYSQEARAYSLYTLMCALAMLCFLRAEREPGGRRLAAFAIASALALLTHYFAVFLVVPMALWLARRKAWRVPALGALGAIGLTGAALLPLALTQGGRGAEWIGNLTLLSRLEAIPQYYLTGYSGAPLGRGVELLVALPLLAGIALGLWRVLDPLHTDRRSVAGATLSAALLACGVGIPLLLVGFGADYLDPRNVIGAMVPATACVAVLVAAPRTGRAGAVLGALSVLALLAVTVDVNLSPRLQRGDWSGVARVVRGDSAGLPAGERAVVSVHLGTAPLEYYDRGLRGVPASRSLALREIYEVGYAPLSRDAGTPPAAGFALVSRREVHGLYVFTFRSAVHRIVSAAALISHPFTLDQGLPAVLAG